MTHNVTWCASPLLHRKPWNLKKLRWVEQTNSVICFPDVDSNIAPSDLEKYSIAPSASAQVIADITTQTNLRRIAEQRAVQIQARCDELAKKLQQAAKNRKRKPTKTATASGGENGAAAVNPQKRPSPPRPLTDVLATQRAAMYAHDSNATDVSDDEVPSPDDANAPKQPTFEGLNSVLCEYKKSKDNNDGSFQPSYEGPLTFTVCAEMADEEAQDIEEWSLQQKIERRPMIVSALRLVYKNKKEDWFSRSFLTSPLGAAEYWQEVLRRRAVLWREAHKSAQEKAEAANNIVSPVRSSVHKRLQQKLKKRSSKKPALSPPAAADNSPISISSDPEDSLSPIDSSQTAGDHAKKTKKSAPNPKSYTREEIKKFASMAKRSVMSMSPAGTPLPWLISLTLNSRVCSHDIDAQIRKQALLTGECRMCTQTTQA